MAAVYLVDLVYCVFMRLLRFTIFLRLSVFVLKRSSVPHITSSVKVFNH